jgi:hypothetical protein
MYKILNTNVPNYFMDIFHQLVGEIQPYNMRNNQNVATPNASLTPSMKYFVPRVTQLWNQLETRGVRCSRGKLGGFPARADRIRHFALSHLTISHFTLKMNSPLESP